MRILLLGVAMIAYGADLTTPPPAQVGLSGNRLAQINTIMLEHVQAGDLKGAAGLIARNGKVAFRESWGDVKQDTLVRLFSITKPVTGVAAMMLYEEGRFSLNDPLSRYLPEFKNMRVAHESFDAAGKRTFYTVPAERPILIRDLFRHTSGLDYNGPKLEDGEFAYKKVDMIDEDYPVVPFNLAEGVKRLATAPLNDQPGTTFRYGYSIDVLGRLVEVLSGKSLDQFFEERIFRPLGMKDTAFFAPEEKWNRLAVLYEPKRGGGIQVSDSTAQEGFKKKPPILLGGEGLVSTLDDYAHFCMMLTNGGEFNGVRLLSRKTVELIGSDQLGNLGHGTVPTGYGSGFTVAVNLGPGRVGAVGSEGEFYWGGLAGTSFWVDSKEHMCGVFMTNLMPPDNSRAADQFKREAYLALE